MNRYRGPTIGGPSKATASTLCQKCLKKDMPPDISCSVTRLINPPRHYSYECKAVEQERPYVSRPSRTQQLLNPKLVPKLTSDVPQDLLRKKGIADEELEKREQERGRKRERQYDDFDLDIERKSVRSASYNSSLSVATISTKASQSPQLPEERYKQRLNLLPTSRTSNSERKRRRSSISSEASYISESNQARDRQLDRTSDRHTRRKFNEASPIARGRRKSRTPSRGRRPSSSSVNDHTRTDRKTSRARSRTRSPKHQRTSSPAQGKHTDADGANRLPNRGLTRRQGQSPIRSGPKSMRRPRDRSFSSDSLGRRRYSDVDERYGTSSRDNGPYARQRTENREPPRRIPPRERSLSPFSKRLALTQSMNTGK